MAVRSWSCLYRVVLLDHCCSDEIDDDDVGTNPYDSGVVIVVVEDHYD